MNAPRTQGGAEWLGLAGVGLGLVVALIVERNLETGPGERPFVFAAVTAVVAMLWLVAARLLFTPQVVQAPVPKDRRR
jgi:hypothetical protein